MAQNEIGVPRDRMIHEAASKKNKDPEARCLNQFGLSSFSKLQLGLGLRFAESLAFHKFFAYSEDTEVSHVIFNVRSNLFIHNNV